MGGGQVTVLRRLALGLVCIAVFVAGCQGRQTAVPPILQHQRSMQHRVQPLTVKTPSAVCWGTPSPFLGGAVHRSHGTVSQIVYLQLRRLVDGNTKPDHVLSARATRSGFGICSFQMRKIIVLSRIRRRLRLAHHICELDGEFLGSVARGARRVVFNGNRRYRIDRSYGPHHSGARVTTGIAA
jgi:hypothetical protein